MTAFLSTMSEFYNHLILSGTKIAGAYGKPAVGFYNHLILSGTKIRSVKSHFSDEFYNHLILSSTKIYADSGTCISCFTIT